VVTFRQMDPLYTVDLSDPAHPRMRGELEIPGFSGYLRQMFTNVWCLLMHWRVAGLRPAPELTLSTHRGPRLAYAVPVLAGLMVTIWLQ